MKLRIHGCWWGRLLLVMVVLQLAVIVPSASADSANEELLNEVRALRQRVEDLERQNVDREAVRANRALSDVSAEGTPRIEMNWGGQYRINAYSVGDNGEDAGNAPTAARVRIRQNLDFTFTDDLWTHLQIEMGHTTHNVSTTDMELRVRHAVMHYDVDDNLALEAGILPLADRFGDTLFSADWNYNPVAIAMLGGTPWVDGDEFRVFAGNIEEGDEWASADDFTHLQFDYQFPLADNANLNFGVSTSFLEDPMGRRQNHSNFGVGAHWEFVDGIHLRGFVVGSHADGELIGASDDANGVAVKMELDFTKCGFGIMGTYASGESDGGGFLPVMALAGTNGYWGYTGLLTVQGPTDTGFDGDSVNISNNGYGLATVQMRYKRPISDKLDLYLAGGWFGGSNTPAGRSNQVGLDGLVMGTYHFNDYLALDVGAAYARLEDSVSGYYQGVVGGAAFNDDLGTVRDKYALFTRIQLEF